MNYWHEWDKETITIVNGVGGRETKTFLEARNNLLPACLLITCAQIPKQYHTIVILQILKQFSVVIAIDSIEVYDL